jgi:O-antigen/teichoic acid export membrane protein
MATEAAYGRANLLLGLLGLGMNIGVAPTTNSQLRFYPDFKKKGLEFAFLRVVRRRVLIAVLIIVLVMAVGLPFARTIVGKAASPVEIAILALMAASLAFKGIEINRLNSDRRQLAQSLWNGLEPGTILGFTAAALYYSSTAASLLLGQLLGGAIMLLFFSLSQKQRDVHESEFTVKQKQDLNRELFAYGAPFTVIAILSWIGNLGDRYVLGSCLGTAEVGIYAASFGLASRPILLMSGVVNQVLRPVLFEATSINNEKIRRKATVWWFLVVSACGFVAASLFALFGDWVADILLAKSFRPHAGAIMAWVAFGYAFFTLGQAVENQLMARYKSGRLILPQLVGGLTNLGLALYLIPRGGIIGAAQANMGSFVVQFLATLYMWRMSVGRLGELGPQEPKESS